MKPLIKRSAGDNHSVTPSTFFAHDEKHLQRQLETPNGVDVKWVHATQCTWASANLILMQRKDQAQRCLGFICWHL